MLQIPALDPIIINYCARYSPRCIVPRLPRSHPAVPIVPPLQSHRRGKREGDSAPAHRRPDRQRIGTHLFGREALGIRHRTWHRYRDRLRARVAGCAERDPRDRIRGRIDLVREHRAAGIARHAVSESDANVIVLERDDGPGNPAKGSVLLAYHDLHADTRLQGTKHLN